MTQIIIEKVVADGHKGRYTRMFPGWSVDNSLRQGILVDYATVDSECVADDNAEIQPVNLFDKSKTHPYISIGKNYGWQGVEISGLQAAEAELKIKYGTDCIVVWELDEIPIFSSCYNNPHMLRSLFENHYTMLTDFHEVGIGQINAIVIRQHLFKRSDIVNWHQLFRHYEILPKGVFCNTANSSAPDFMLEEISQYNVHLLEPMPSFWYLTLAWKNNSRLLDGSFKQSLLDFVEQQYLNPAFKKSFVLPVHKSKVERTTLFTKLDHAQLLSECDWSYFPKSFRTKLNAQELEFMEKYKHQLSTPIEDDSAKIKMLVYSDDHKNKYNPYEIHFNWLNNYNYYFCVETNIADNRYTMLTEKTFKGIGAGLTSVWASGAGHNAKLNQLGFRTTFADELNYDHIEDFDERMNALIANFKLRMFDNKKNYLEDACSNLERFADVDVLMDLIHRPLEKIKSLVTATRLDG